MKILTIGACIKAGRENLKLSQEELSEGLCTPIMLSRIENDKAYPSARLLNALLERLGLPGERFYALVSAEEEKIENLKKEITNCNIAARNYPKERERGWKLLDELEMLAGENDPLIRQYILRSRGILGTPDGPYSLEEKLDIYMEAIHMTIPRFQTEELLNFRYSLDEIKVVDRIAEVYSDMGDHEQALVIYRQCYRYVQKNNREIVRTAGLIPFISYNYAQELGMAGFYNNSIEVAEAGRKACIRQKHYQQLPGLIHLKAEYYRRAGNDKKAKEQYILAGNLYQIIENRECMELLASVAKKYYDLDFSS